MRWAAVSIALLRAMLAQSPATPAIEVATIKLNKSGDAIGNRFDPERMSWTATPLKVLIGEAYGVHSYQIAGGAAWIDTDRWDINVKTDGPTTNRQKLELLAVLLADRFQLKSHRESREMKGYKLVAAPGGAKLAAAKEDSIAPGMRINRGQITGHRMAVADLARFLQSELGRPVQEATGLTGRYDFHLEWVPDESQPTSEGQASPPDAEGATVFRAIQEQLGLKLEAQKIPGEMLVIDRVAKPGAN